VLLSRQYLLTQGECEIEDKTVRVKGTKTAHAELFIHLLYPVAKPGLTYWQLNRRLEKLKAPVPSW
jgi:hypothetical protein